MFFSATNFAAGGKLPQTDMKPEGFCEVSASSAMALCIGGYPPLVAYEGDASPNLEIYFIKQNSGRSGIVQLMFDANDNPIGAFTTSLFDGSLFPAYGFGTTSKSFHKNSDGSYTVANWGNGESAPTTLTFPSFQRTDHTGTTTYFEGTTEEYTASSL